MCSRHLHSAPRLETTPVLQSDTLASQRPHSCPIGGMSCCRLGKPPPLSVPTSHPPVSSAVPHFAACRRPSPVPLPMQTLTARLSLGTGPRNGAMPSLPIICRLSVCGAQDGEDAGIIEYKNSPIIHLPFQSFCILGILTRSWFARNAKMKYEPCP